MTIVVHSCPPTKGLVSFPSMMSVLPTAKGLITSQLRENTRQTCLRYHCDTGYSPGAVILTDVHGPLGGTLARLTVNTHGLFGFILQWQLPEVTQGRMTDDDGQPAVFLLARDGSRAEVTTTATTHEYPVRQYGPQRLWDHVERAATFWNKQGRPSYERFGITATPQGQHIWYDQPDGPHHWPLPRVDD